MTAMSGSLNSYRNRVVIAKNEKQDDSEGYRITI